MADTAQFWLNQLSSAQIKAESVRIKQSLHEYEKKKKKRSSDATDFSIYQVVFLNSMITKSRVPELETTADDPLNKDHYV